MTIDQRINKAFQTKNGTDFAIDSLKNRIDILNHSEKCETFIIEVNRYANAKSQATK